MSEAVEWREHAHKIAELAARHRGALRTAAERGVTVTFDTAIEAGDISFAMLEVVLEPDLLADLASVEARFVVTMYRGPETSDQRQ